jgi:hypothetical protein
MGNFVVLIYVMEQSYGRTAPVRHGVVHPGRIDRRLLQRPAQWYFLDDEFMNLMHSSTASLLCGRRLALARTPRGPQQARAAGASHWPRPVPVLRRPPAGSGRQGDHGHWATPCGCRPLPVARPITSHLPVVIHLQSVVRNF